MMQILSRHLRFLTGFGFGLIVGLICWTQGLPVANSLLYGVDGFFALYLWLMARLTVQTGPAELRRHSDQADEGIGLILVLALLAVSVSIAAILVVINAPASGLIERCLALITLPLGWTMVHTLAAFHYAHLYYRGGGGLEFPGKAQPGAWEFMYFSFTIGMTAQVSDVVATNRPMRQLILGHGVASFFYNTSIIAIAVNAAITGAG